MDVLGAVDSLLGTIDFDNVSNVVDVDELPTFVDVDRIPEALERRDVDLAVDLPNLEKAVDKRELWNSVDLVEFARAKQEVERELSGIFGGTPPVEVGGDSEADAEVEAVVSSFRAESKEVLVQQEAQKKAAVLREAVVDRHADLERLYESNRKRFGGANGGAARNPTAVSLMPSGPLPDGVSTRFSGVPSGLPYARIDPLPRIYGRRWRSGRSGSSGK